MMTYHKELPPINLHDPLMIKVLIYHKELPPVNLHDPLITCHVRPRDKLNTLYLHLHKIHGHQTRQDADL